MELLPCHAAVSINTQKVGESGGSGEGSISGEGGVSTVRSAELLVSCSATRSAQVETAEDMAKVAEVRRTWRNEVY